MVFNEVKFNEVVAKYEKQVELAAKEVAKLQAKLKDLSAELREARNKGDELAAEEIIGERSDIKNEIADLKQDIDLYEEIINDIQSIVAG